MFHQHVAHFFASTVAQKFIVTWLTFSLTFTEGMLIMTTDKIVAVLLALLLLCLVALRIILESL